MTSQGSARAVFKAAWKGLSHDRAQLRRLILASITVALVAMAPAFFAAWLLDGPLAFSDGSSLKVLLVGMAGVYVAKDFFEWFKGRLQLYVDAVAQASIKEAAYRRYLDSPWLVAGAKPVGDLMIGFSGLGEAYDYLSKQIAPLAVNGVSLLFQLVAIFIMSPGIGWAALGAILLLVVSGEWTGRKQTRPRVGAAMASADESMALSDLLAGIRTIKSFGLEDEAMARWQSALRRRVGFDAKGNRIQVFGSGIGRLITSGFPAVAMLIGTAQIVDGIQTFGEVLGSIFLAGAVLEMAYAIVSARMTYLGLKPRLVYAAEILGLEPVQHEQLPPVGAEEGWVTAEDVWFRYRQDGPWVVKGLNLRVGPGTKHEIEGASGQGKSTILRLLAGLLEPERGQILVGGRNPAQARKDLLYLPQFPQLISDSIRRNLGIYSAGASWESVLVGARETGFDEIVEGLPLGYDTRLVVTGANLSGGQRQLLLLTACLASEKPVLLLDEAMAGIDWGRRAKLERSPLLQGKTIIFASHDAPPSVA